MTSLSIISCTNTNQLSDFIAHMVPKIWSGTTNTSAHFKLFCQNMIKATQVSSSCILIALFYIYKLRFTYPSIKASIGSEVRLFTTALILANKFLDDNTFTNKTWSEVSSIPLNELNIMEIEFLSALQYRTRIHHVQFFSWASQCQHWMSKLMTRPIIVSAAPISVPIMKMNNYKSCIHPALISSKKKTSVSHPYYHPRQNNNYLSNPYHPQPKQMSHSILEPVLSWSSSNPSYTTFRYPDAASVATAAAATAINVNYSNFISKVSPQQ